MQLNINSDAAVKFTAKLERLHRSALPVAIRQSLNSAAFNVKQDTMPRTAKGAFTERRKNFFKATSRVQMAKGFDISAMKSTVGFIGGSNNQAVRDLEEQEYGGDIKGRSFIPLKTARVSKNNKKVVARRNRLKNIKKVRTIRSRKNLFKKAAIIGIGNHFIYESTLYRIQSLKSGKLKLLPLYDYKKGRSASISATGFMRKATTQSAKKLDNYYEIEAKKQIARLK